MIGLLVTTIFAGGYYVGDIDAVANGQGGAFIAAPDTPAALYFNPGALTRGRGLRLQLEGGFIYCSMDYARADDAAQTGYPRVANQQPFQPAGFVGAVHDFGVPNLAVALGGYSPSSNNFEFDERGPQRFLYVDGSILLIHVHAAVAYRLHETVSVGVAAGGAYFRASQRTLVSAALDGVDPENEAYTVPTDLSVNDPFTFTANLGVSWTPIPELSVGLSVMPPFEVAADGKAAIHLPGLLGVLGTVEGDRIRVEIAFPTVVRAGVRARPTPRLDVELAAVFEQWSRLQAIHVEPEIRVSAPALGIDSLDLPALDLAKKQRNLISLRLGGQLRAHRRVDVRAGAWYETAGARPSAFDIATPESQKLGLAAGATFHLPFGAVDVSYSHVFADAVHVVDSELSVINVVEPANTRVVGNGDYDFAYDIVHLGLRAQF